MWSSPSKSHLHVGTISLNTSTKSKQERTKARNPLAGSVYYHAISLSPCCGSVASSTNTSSVEVVISDLETEELSGKNNRNEGKSDEESMSETEKAIREIISAGRKSNVREKPEELRNSISEIQQKKKEAEKELEAKRIHLKRRILEAITQGKCESPEPQRHSERRTSVDRGVSSSSLSFASSKAESAATVSVMPAAASQHAADASYHKALDRHIVRSAVEKGGKRPVEVWKATNRKIVRNALCAVCLCGENNRKLREEVLGKMEECKDTSLFVIVFKGVFAHHSFAALYAHDFAQGSLTKVFGHALYPEKLAMTQITACYRYESSAREFRKAPQKRLTLGTDAVSVLIRRK